VVEYFGSTLLYSHVPQAHTMYSNYNNWLTTSY